ncbi:hypothetical protein PIB30_001862 [Stylosanthes scabra]|uniref:Uncharacterized protein n=1 Tax=Stylosanthes scabra TaxID=79078 RepID=A0ABU6W4K7_9FABA|nr:hypothetical protein [Stylosanthes scabra]
MAAFKFLVSLRGGLPKKNKFTCRWILDGSNAEVGKFLDDLLDVKMKRTKLDNLMAMMADPSRMGPRAQSSQVPPVPTASETHKTKRQSSKRDRAKAVNLEGEERLQEDPAADLQQKRRKKKAKVDDAFEKVLGEDSAWEHDVDPLKVAFPESFSYRKALNAGLTSAPVREALTKMPQEQLLCESYNLAAQSLACLQVGVETSLAAKMKAEKELSAALNQIEVLKGERYSALSYLPFKEKADTLRLRLFLVDRTLRHRHCVLFCPVLVNKRSLKDELSEKSLEHQSALDRIAQLEEDNGVLKTQFESSQLSLEGERKRSAAAEKHAGSLAASLKTCQADLSKATEASEYWRSEWQKLGTEVTEMCQETLDICLDQVSHLCPGVDFSAITLKSRWDPKGRRIFVPQESDVEEELPHAEEVVAEQHPEPTVQASQSATGDMAGVSGGCPT